MNSRDSSKYLVIGIFAGILLVATLLAYILYVPEQISTDSFGKSNKKFVNEKALTYSKHTSLTTVTERQDRIDTVYIYNQKEPLIVFANIQSAPSGPSLAEAETEDLKNEDKGGNFVEKDIMEAFEQAFNNVVEQEKKRNEAQLSDDTEPQNQSVDHGIMSEGMILDETQTRMGGTFFSYFYNHWQAPQEASNFMITVKEKIMPSMGSSVSIKINEELVFQTRLQPRYDYIEQMGQRAVTICYRRLQQTSDSEYYQVY